MSEATEELLKQIEEAGLPAPVLEYRFCPDRKWRFDLCFPLHRLAVEVVGGVHVGGRHVRGPGYEKDCEKENVAVVLGWKVLRFTPSMIAKREGVGWLECLLPSSLGTVPVGGVIVANLADVTVQLEVQGWC